MSDFSGFLAMGGYAGYVWSAFAVTLAVLVGLLIASLRTLRRRQAFLAGLEKEGRRR